MCCVFAFAFVCLCVYVSMSVKSSCHQPSLLICWQQFCYQSQRRRFSDNSVLPQVQSSLQQHTDAPFHTHSLAWPSIASFQLIYGDGLLKVFRQRKRDAPCLTGLRKASHQRKRDVPCSACHSYTETMRTEKQPARRKPSWQRNDQYNDGKTVTTKERPLWRKKDRFDEGTTTMTKERPFWRRNDHHDEGMTIRTRCWSHPLPPADLRWWLSPMRERCTLNFNFNEHF
jgi:hypothetical protein